MWRLYISNVTACCFFNGVVVLFQWRSLNMLMFWLQLGSILVVVRLAENGCLLNQLKKNRENPYINVEERHVYFSHIDKTRIARDVASGMLHLSSKKVNICYSKHKTKLIERNVGGVAMRSANFCKSRWLVGFPVSFSTFPSFSFSVDAAINGAKIFFYLSVVNSLFWRCKIGPLP